MDEFVKLLDRNLEYVSHKIIEDTIYIKVVSIREKLICPFCGKPSSKTHSHYERSFQDLPMQNKKVIIILSNRKMLCYNPDCEHTTFAETYDFLPVKGKKTKRLEEAIINLSLNVSSLTASAILNTSIAKVGKSTICNLLKKRRTNN
ncbi:transposase family protein [Desulfosporosinus sp. Sb-LF]|uniref:transposase family protein n=1 Tax=Desulfosporosinus sp. Sb-LF TaxID=2560027 RepID=UPI001102E997|nr:transposase family protein [Desulfosporosinus sp. Sb-LF]TGE34334.1 transposase family protein [Desulfosporosinus sp. Sb-LF]